jgi:hypothetical protein
MSDCNGTLKFLAMPSLKSLGKVRAASRLWDAASLTWVTQNRLLAVDRAGGGEATLLVIDTATKRVVRRAALEGVVIARAVAGNRLVLLVAPFDSFGPARVIVAGADGVLHTATIDAISAGSHFASPAGPEPAGEMRVPGFAVDPAGTAFVVGPDLKVAAVDLATMRVGYHGPTRSLAKALNGTARTAAWLGGGKLAVSGLDYAAAGTGPDLKMSTTPFGLHVLDTATWTYRTLDPAAQGMGVDGSTILAYVSPNHWSAYSTSGSQLYDVTGPETTMVASALGYTYVCTDRWLTRVLDSATGAQVSAPKGRGCPMLLSGRAGIY